MNKFMNGLTNATNYTVTENGALTHRTTKSDLLDLFAMGAAYRKRSEADVITLFKNAYAENPTYALKCLFYIRDVRGGQGERRFFRVAMKWLAQNDPDAVTRNLEHIPEFGRWDDLYILVGTPVEKKAFAFIKKQLALDVQSKTPSLLAKWLKSENTSSADSKVLGNITRKYLNMSHKEYRKVLSALRTRINVLEKLMSEKRWDEIEFDKIPSKAGMIYKNAFARHDVERMRQAVEKNIVSYEDFAKDKNTKVNAKTLYPYECVQEALKCSYRAMSDTQRLMTNKYWDNLADYFKGATFNGLAVVDTSGSMHGIPINVAISLGMYCAEKAKGPFANHYISFASRPQLIRVNGADFVDKVKKIYDTNLVDNTNIEGVFDLLLNTAIRNGCSQDDLPQNILIISDMEFDHAARYSEYSWNWNRSERNARYTSFTKDNANTLLEEIAKKWKAHGYEMPHLVFWNVDARQNNIPMMDNGRVSYVSGFSPSIFQTLMSGKTGMDLCLEKLNSERYACIH